MYILRGIMFNISNAFFIAQEPQDRQSYVKKKKKDYLNIAKPDESLIE